MPRLAVFLLLAVAALTIPTTRGLNPRKLDDTTGENKCGGCPCNNPCPVPSPPPPPPALPPPSPPPPKKPPSSYCPPPPGGGYVPSGPTTPNNQYIYFNGPPGNLYPVDQYFSGAGKPGFSLVIAGAFLGFLALFW
nr:chitin-binding lectin 1-like [Ipomoea batatas]